MGLNQPTLMMFETARRQANHIPPQGSNSFYTIGSGEINLLVKRSDPEDYRFDIFTNKGTIYTGPGNFLFAGDIHDTNKPYGELTVITETQLSVNHILTISGGKMDVHGTLELMSHSQLVIRDNAKVTMFLDSTFIIRDDTQILIEKGSSLTIYGGINIHLNRVDSLVNTDGIIIDSAAVMTVDGMDLLGKREYSLTDYDAYLRTKVINVDTQGSIDTPHGRICYTWKDGSPLNKSQLLRMNIMWGNVILGDFKYSVLGVPEKIIDDLQIIQELIVEKGTTLHITEEYQGYRYIRPSLYLGIIVDNCKQPASCTVNGKIVVDDKNCTIIIDRGSSLKVSKGGELWLNHGAKLLNTHNDEDAPLLYLDGTLYIEDLSQIESFSHDNIIMGEDAKVVIFNPEGEERRVLFSTPNGIHDSDLYKFFRDRIDQVEYHIPKNTGIVIDQYYDFYARQFTDWYGGRRIEKAIHDGIIVWHDGAFIELNSEVIPWVNSECTLLHAARLFKTFGSFDTDKLQEAVERLKYAGAGNIVFRFVDGDHFHEVTMVLDGITMKNVVNHPLTHMYVLTTDNDGELFMRSKVANATVKSIINPNSRQLEIEGKKVEFPL